MTEQMGESIPARTKTLALAAKHFGLRLAYSDYGPMLRRGLHVEIPARQLLFWLDR